MTPIGANASPNHRMWNWRCMYNESQMHARALGCHSAKSPELVCNVRPFVPRMRRPCSVPPTSWKTIQLSSSCCCFKLRGPRIVCVPGDVSSIRSGGGTCSPLTSPRTWYTLRVMHRQDIKFAKVAVCHEPRETTDLPFVARVRCVCLGHRERTRALNNPC